MCPHSLEFLSVLHALAAKSTHKKISKGQQNPREILAGLPAQKKHIKQREKIEQNKNKKKMKEKREERQSQNPAGFIGPMGLRPTSNINGLP